MALPARRSNRADTQDSTLAESVEHRRPQFVVGRLQLSSDMCPPDARQRRYDSTSRGVLTLTDGPIESACPSP